VLHPGGYFHRQALGVLIPTSRRHYLNAVIRKLDGANMDIDLATPPDRIQWRQDRCPWNEAEATQEHRCAVKNISICPFFCGIEHMDNLLCCYPHENPLREQA
jgi:hypothetical protein